MATAQVRIYEEFDQENLYFYQTSNVLHYEFLKYYNHIRISLTVINLTNQHFNIQSLLWLRSWMKMGNPLQSCPSWSSEGFLQQKQTESPGFALVHQKGTRSL